MPFRSLELEPMHEIGKLISRSISQLHLEGLIRALDWEYKVLPHLTADQINAQSPTIHVYMHHHR
jgi:hypothetical protein